MSQTELSSPTERPGRAPLRRRARRALLVGLAGLAASAVLFGQLDRIWPVVGALDGAPFMLLAALLGGALAVSPLAALIGFWLALWWAVESVAAPHTTQTPRIDRAIYAVGLVVWASPSLALLVLTAQALVSGRVHFARPPRDYFLATDPVPYWQSIGFWLVSAVMLGFLAWRYWQPRLAALRTRTP